jgi:hypothetical protein
MADNHNEDDTPEIKDIGSNPAPSRSMDDLINTRLSRRAALQGIVGAGAAALFANRLVDEAVAQPAPIPRQAGRLR